MKKLFALIATLTLFISISNANATNIAVLDIEKVVENSIAMKNVNRKLTKKKDVMQKELKKEEAVLNAKRDDIASKSNILSKEALNKKMMDFQKDVMTFQQKVKAEEDKLKNAYMEAISDITDEIKVVVEDMQSEDKYNFDLVIASSVAVYSSDSLDISAVVLKRLNKKVKSIALNLE